MDAIDEKLLLALRENARASTAKLARLVGRSRTSVQTRIERLEKDGVIVGYGVRLAPEHDLGAVRAHAYAPSGSHCVDSLGSGISLCRVCGQKGSHRFMMTALSAFIPGRGDR